MAASRTPCWEYDVHKRPGGISATAELLVAYTHTGGAGLWRMEQLIHDERLRHAEVVPVRIDDVTNCYSSLREMDSRDDPRAKKYIVLDLATDDSLRRILKQVRLVTRCQFTH